MKAQPFALSPFIPATIVEYCKITSNATKICSRPAAYNRCEEKRIREERCLFWRYLFENVVQVDAFSFAVYFCGVVDGYANYVGYDDYGSTDQ